MLVYLAEKLQCFWSCHNSSTRPVCHIFHIYPLSWHKIGLFLWEGVKFGFYCYPVGPGASLEQTHLERFISSPWLAFLRETTREPKITKKSDCTKKLRLEKRRNICTKYLGVGKKKGIMFGSFWDNIWTILETWNLICWWGGKERDHIWEAFRKSRPAAMMQCGSLLIEDQLAADLKKTQYCTNKIQIQIQTKTTQYCTNTNMKCYQSFS